ncbi:hypothetical protein CONPUDRAFT_146622 [Coniophora puteana RWD-64-598 SS2]|uniref:Uncharacterized protein n=1 Tax=Coniophora puteana (strain RWD-64-598) TaxID=741705 RepID=A0A5M3MCY7_CONPW|nr:uncharacterized protein CONPUDRAFT_146622 [Coniophora puteana RWD-64-598 SS2]EIW76943.1 hypothetical protein CONPUDRAFT_146622 [Coniophora puteana RWD-64-598 SS2]
MPTPRPANEVTLWRSHWNVTDFRSRIGLSLEQYTQLYNVCRNMLRDHPTLCDSIFDPSMKSVLKDAVTEANKNPRVDWLIKFQDSWPLEILLKRIMNQRAEGKIRNGKRNHTEPCKKVRFGTLMRPNAKERFSPSDDEGEDEIETSYMHHSDMVHCQGHTPPTCAQQAIVEMEQSTTLSEQKCETGHEAVLSFLRSCPGNLETLLPAFIQHGIKSKREVDILLSLPAGDRERWIERRRESLGLSDLEAAALQVKCNQEQSGMTMIYCDRHTRSLTALAGSLKGTRIQAIVMMPPSKSHSLPRRRYSRNDELRTNYRDFPLQGAFGTPRKFDSHQAERMPRYLSIRPVYFDAPERYGTKEEILDTTFLFVNWDYLDAHAQLLKYTTKPEQIKRAFVPCLQGGTKPPYHVKFDSEPMAFKQPITEGAVADAEVY